VPRSTASPGQLEAGLVGAPATTPAGEVEAVGLAAPTALSELPIAPEWKSQQRLWGHAFHPMCSYLAMFPAALAHAFIARYSRAGDVVLDPFSGRGTTPLQACAEGRIGIGTDLNPLAAVLTAAKVDAPGRLEAEARLANLRIRWSFEASDWIALAQDALAAPGPGGVRVPAAGGSGPASSLPAEVALCFHPHTLGQLLMVREALQLGERTDRFLAAATCGILHGKSRAYLSDVMPNSFSMAPRYVRDFVARTGYRPGERDLFEALEGKLGRLYRQGLPPVRGLGLHGDARDAGRRIRLALGARSLPDRARLVVTSPPYLRVVKYGYYNWLRMWFLGVDPAGVDASLDDGHRLPEWLAFLRVVLGGLRAALTDDAVVVLVIGDVALDRGRAIGHGLGLAETVWREAAAPEGYLLAGLARDDIMAHRKMTRIWGEEAGRATTVDRILVVAPGELGRRRALSSAATPIDWTWPPRSPARRFPIAELPAGRSDGQPARRTYTPARCGRCITRTTSRRWTRSS
jgi:site-specific DNA-methyltransferase (adenine-specific)